RIRISHFQKHGNPMPGKAAKASGAESVFGKADFSTLAGLLVAALGILGGLLLEGGKFSDVAQFTAAMIVLGGTAGAVMVTTPMPVLLAAVRKLPHVFRDSTPSSSFAIEQIL